MLSKPTCLIVDDSDVMRRIMRVIIEGLELQVDEAHSCSDALSRCRLGLPNVIVLDWHIPGSTPIEFITSVRSMPRGRDVKILFTISANDPVEIGRAITAGANAYMLRPFRRVQLEAKIAELTARPVDVSENAEPVRPVARAI